MGFWRHGSQGCRKRPMNGGRVAGGRAELCPRDLEIVPETLRTSHLRCPLRPWSPWRRGTCPRPKVCSRSWRRTWTRRSFECPSHGCLGGFRRYRALVFCPKAIEEAQQRRAVMAELKSMVRTRQWTHVRAEPKWVQKDSLVFAKARCLV